MCRSETPGRCFAGRRRGSCVAEKRRSGEAEYGEYGQQLTTETRRARSSTETATAKHRDPENGKVYRERQGTSERGTDRERRRSPLAVRSGGPLMPRSGVAWRRATARRAVRPSARRWSWRTASARYRPAPYRGAATRARPPFVVCRAATRAPPPFVVGPGGPPRRGTGPRPTEGRRPVRGPRSSSVGRRPVRRRRSPSAVRSGGPLMPRSGVAWRRATAHRAVRPSTVPRHAPRPLPVPRQ